MIFLKHIPDDIGLLKWETNLSRKGYFELENVLIGRYCYALNSIFNLENHHIRANKHLVLASARMCSRSPGGTSLW